MLLPKRTVENSNFVKVHRIMKGVHVLLSLRISNFEPKFFISILVSFVLLPLPTYLKNNPPTTTCLETCQRTYPIWIRKTFFSFPNLNFCAKPKTDILFFVFLLNAYLIKFFSDFRVLIFTVAIDQYTTVDVYRNILSWPIPI